MQKNNGHKYTLKNTRCRCIHIVTQNPLTFGAISHWAHWHLVHIQIGHTLTFWAHSHWVHSDISWHKNNGCKYTLKNNTSLVQALIMWLGDHGAQYMGAIALLKWADPFSMGFCFLQPTHFRWPILESWPRRYQRRIRDNLAKSAGPLWMGDCHTLLARQWWTHLTALTGYWCWSPPQSSGQHIVML